MVIIIIIIIIIIIRIVWNQKAAVLLPYMLVSVKPHSFLRLLSNCGRTNFSFSLTFKENSTCLSGLFFVQSPHFSSNLVEEQCDTINKPSM